MALTPSDSGGVTGETRLEELESRLGSAEIPPAALLAEAALAAAKPEAVGGTATREGIEFVAAVGRDKESLGFGSEHEFRLDSNRVEEGVIATNAAIKVIHDVSEAYEVSLFRILGMRNLSSFVGELFKDQLAVVMKDEVVPNPHQDGHPDLMALTSASKEYLMDLEKAGRMSVKEFFSPFPFGGLEVKATCGDTPPARVRPKPSIGESRLPILTGLNWKAHHRETNYLLSIVWDFVDGVPTVLAVFFRNDLGPNDWGRTVTPGTNSRTTSVSIMNAGGVRKMGEGWMVLPRSSDVGDMILAAMRIPAADRPY